MRKKLVMGNWKLNGSTDTNHTLLAACIEQSQELDKVEIAVCPSFIHIPAASQQLKGSNIAIGSQNMCEQQEGAYTGEISAAMLAEFNCKYAIIGHSERRQLYSEPQSLLTQKVEQALANKIVPVYCIGETQTERENGQTEAIIQQQLDPIIELGVQALSKIVIAYEPVWAIGTGLAASAEQAQAVHAFIRQRLAKADTQMAEQVQILYGGSVKPANAAELFQQADIDGGLIGGASLKASDFMAIAKAAN